MRCVLAVFLLCSACIVDDDFLQNQYFACDGPSDCGSAWGCVRASPYAVDFCAPDCSDQNCDGICTVQDGRSLCLRGCRINDDGTTSSCSSPEFACIRTSADRDDGVCYPVSPCAVSEDCPSGHICATQFLDASSQFRERRSYCIPVPDDAGECPPRSVNIPISGGGAVCLATCAPPDTRCPPGFGCLQQAAVASESGDVICYPGLYGLPCDDDSNCFFGRCIDTGDAGKQCTLTCGEAARIAGGCDGVLSISNRFPSFAFECDPAAGGGEDGGLCVTRSSIGFVCTTPESDAYVCEEGLTCRSFPLPSQMDGQPREIRVCTKDCDVDVECGAANFCYAGNPSIPASCLPECGSGVGGVCVEPV